MREKHFHEFLVLLLAELALGLSNQFAACAVFSKATEPGLLKCREVVGLDIFEVHDPTIFKNRREWLHNARNLLHRQFRALFVRVESPALLR